jgi:EAL domain-containing protein (putative c-di-GMP-specific phosphodiesterase class I)
LFLEYQPQVDAALNTIIGFEALVRWRNPTRGLVPPSTIIPVAETTGLIVELGTWVLRETLRQGKAWLDAGYPPTILAVNLSGVEMRASDFETVVLREIEASGYPPRLLELEITESVFFETSRIHHDALKRLRDAGVRFAIDDFGTGYSSLEYLLRFRVDRLKIAQTFMHEVTTDPIAAVIVRAAIGLAHDLGIEVIAEGAETAEQVEFLRREDCPHVQGYYFSRPLASAAAEKLLRQGASVSDLSRAA